MITPALLQAIRQQYRLHWGGLHGYGHWARVYENGCRLAAVNGANRAVVELFAVFHDAGRWNDDWDPQHGSRGADLATRLRGQFFDLDDASFTALKYACRLHADGLTEADLTVQTCWDADRLDLGRVGMWPDKAMLCTVAARQPEHYDWANDRAVNRIIPEFAQKQWAVIAN